MTDPNMPPPERPPVQPSSPTVEPVRHTTVNVAPERRSGGGVIPFLIGGLVVVVAIIAFVLFSNSGGLAVPDQADVDVEVQLPSLPEAPDLPTPPVTPPATPPTAPAA